MTEKSSMKILALDFSTFRRSAATLEISGREGRVISCVTQEAQRAGSPFPLIAEALGKIDAKEIEAIAVGLGPGSYTGIRSSLAIAQGWNLARGIPAAGVSSADAIAYNAWTRPMRGSIEVVIDAQRNEVYSAGYHLTAAMSEVSGLLHIDDCRSEKKPTPPGILHTYPLRIVAKPIGNIQVVGPEARRWSAEGLVIEPTALAVGMLAAYEQKFVSPETLEAIYLREPSFVKAPAVRHT